MQFQLIWIALMVKCSKNFKWLLSLHVPIPFSSHLHPSKALKWSQSLSIEQPLICKSPSRLSQVAHCLNAVLSCIYENTQERWRKDVKFKVKKAGQTKKGLRWFSEVSNKIIRITVFFSLIPYLIETTNTGYKLQQVFRRHYTKEIPMSGDS